VDGNEQMGGNKTAIEEPYEESANDNVIVEGFAEERQHPTRTTFWRIVEGPHFASTW